ncbi:MAG: hypothetical protein HYZ72_00735 [Deltaproteobacteria bacterium]|nr:hypothetical protein [Deltaproteobacteria bacterium]
MAEEQNVRGSETERRLRREGILILATALAVFLFALLETRLPQFSDSHSLGTNVIFFLLINLNIILLVLLVCNHVTLSCPDSLLRWCRFYDQLY